LLIVNDGSVVSLMLCRKKWIEDKDEDKDDNYYAHATVAFVSVFNQPSIYTNKSWFSAIMNAPKMNLANGFLVALLGQKPSEQASHSKPTQLK
jgi:hypothetical protein